MSNSIHATKNKSERRVDVENANEPAPIAADDNKTAEDNDSEGDEEPNLKHARLTSKLANLYLHGDSTSAVTTVGGKMVVGTHDGYIHVLALPNMESLQTYRAHSANVTSVSVSSIPPVAALVRTSTSHTSKAPMYIATSSLDGHVVVSSLLDPQHIQLRNFGRPVNAVALSPEYKSDRTYLSGGLAGSLILTVGGTAGKVDANTSSAAATSLGWLGALGLGANAGKDQVLHSGEGAISTIKWSLSGKWVVWANGEGIKIMRSHLKLESANSEDAWRRIAHVSRPNEGMWNEMANVWKTRCEWINEQEVERDEFMDSGMGSANSTVRTSAAPSKDKNKFETLAVGWGDTAWILHVQPAQSPHARNQIGNAEIIYKLWFQDTAISGITFYTPGLLAILSCRTKDNDNVPAEQAGSKSFRPSELRRHHRHNGLPPQMTLVNVQTGEEVEYNELSGMQRYETLSSQDYHLGNSYMPLPVPENTPKDQIRTKLEPTFTGGSYATRMFSSSTTIFSGDGSDKQAKSGTSSFKLQRQGSYTNATPSPGTRKTSADMQPYILKPGLKLFIHSPYDCVLAVKRELSDRVEWLLEHHRFEDAWTLIDKHTEVVHAFSPEPASHEPQPSSLPRTMDGSAADFFADDSESNDNTTVAALRADTSDTQRMKCSIGDSWLQQLVSRDQWQKAGEIAGKVLGNSSRWEYWVQTFAQANKFDEIMPFIPLTGVPPALPSSVYELILVHYVDHEPLQLTKLLKLWNPKLFSVNSVIRAIESRLNSGEVVKNTVEDGVKGRDWAMLMEALAKLHLAGNDTKAALRYYIQLQDADQAFSLIREENLDDVVRDDVPGVLTLKLSKAQLRSAPLSKLDEASLEAVQVLIEASYRGTIVPETVIKQLQQHGDWYQPFTYFYMRGLWNGSSSSSSFQTRQGKWNNKFRYNERHALLENHADLAVDLFAEYDRDLLLPFLKSSTHYSYERAAEICKKRNYIPERIHVLSRIGDTEKALQLIIEELEDVAQAISFAKVHHELWDDLVAFSLQKPKFILGLLEEAGAAAAFNSIDVVRRIPKGVEIQGLKQGIQKLVRGFEIQMSISEGVAEALKGEIGMSLHTLRTGRKKGVRFELGHKTIGEVDPLVQDPPSLTKGEELSAKEVEAKKAQSRHCVGCGEEFQEHEKDMLIGFGCEHIYHLPCLLYARQGTSNHDIDHAVEQLGFVATENDDSGHSGRSVGRKVARAHRIKNMVEDGCQHCTTSY